MALELFNNTEEMSKERIIIYGRAGIGKTRLALMLPEKWGEIIYYAADDNAEFLKSIPQAARSRVRVVRPRDKTHRLNFQEFCMRDWKKIYPEAKTLVVDTFTTIAFRVIQELANDGSIPREEHFYVGTKGSGGWALPTRSDYQGIELAAKGFVEMLFDKQRDYNIIFLCHEDARDPERGRMVGGPSVPGRRLLEDLPASFNTVIRLTREQGQLVPGQTMPPTKVVAITDNNGHYIAKLREGDCNNENKLGRVELDRNPINFWLKFDTFMSGMEV